MSKTVTLQEAVDSGRDFRKVYNDGTTGKWLYVNNGFITSCFTGVTTSFSVDLLSARYELKPIEPVTYVTDVFECGSTGALFHATHKELKGLSGKRVKVTVEEID